MKQNIIPRHLVALSFLLCLAGLSSAQPPVPVTDLVIKVGDNHNDVILSWSRPEHADSFHVHAGDSIQFEVGTATRIGATDQTSYTHVGGLTGAQQRFYAVIVFSAGSTEGMVLVPAGLYQMGATYHSPYSVPIHTVNVPAFYMDIHEVTNAQFKAFCDATSRAYPADPGFSDLPNYFTNAAYVNFPVVMVSWEDAQAYATWAGKRLPTEAEWERAAKGDADNRSWPWGNTWVAANANIYDNADGYAHTSPVGNYPAGASPAGCYDMAGNVWEWCEDDWHTSYNGAPTNGSAWISNPRSSSRVIRSASWYSLNVDARCAYRVYNNLTNHYSFIGFRCARTP